MKCFSLPETCHRHAHFLTSIKCSTIQSNTAFKCQEALPENGKPSFSLLAHSSTALLYWKKSRCVYVWVCVYEYALATYWRTQGVWWLFCCTHAVRVALVGVYRDNGPGVKTERGKSVSSAASCFHRSGSPVTFPKLQWAARWHCSCLLVLFSFLKTFSKCLNAMCEQPLPPVRQG